MPSPAPPSPEPHAADSSLPVLGQGFYWQDLSVGQRFRTFRRTVTEADLVSFIGVTGMLEAIFIDAHFDGAMAGRPVPGALTYSLVEGMLFQTMVQGTGLAMLEVQQRALAPVIVGDTIHAVVEVTELRPTSKGNRAVLGSAITVLNQRDQAVMTYTVKRLLAGRPEPAGR
ncbi:MULTISPECIES: MaoC family dehydratase [Acetobacterales]|uniref:MaoC family dehydratase n=1 Tax=Roseomonas sp. WGS1072 TaxID=3366816 RepID=UPI003BF28A9E